MGKYEHEDAQAVEDHDERRLEFSYHWKKPATFWGEALPAMQRDKTGKPLRLVEGLHWSQDRICLLLAWIGSGSVRSLSLALLGGAADRVEYAESRAKARWVADRMAGRVQVDQYSAAYGLLNEPVPRERIERARVTARRLDTAASLIPPAPVDSRQFDASWHAMGSLSAVEALTGLWPPLCDPCKIQVKVASGTIGIMPERQAMIDHDARMLAAEGVF